jgi:hypothetical protein
MLAILFVVCAAVTIGFIDYVLYKCFWSWGKKDEQRDRDKETPI